MQCLTLLVSELVGFPAGRALHDRAHVLTAHDRVLLPAIRAYRGRRITSRGASALAAFGSPTDAVLCGLAIQDLLAARNGDAPEQERLSVRLAVDLGETRFRRGRLIGAPVERARAVCGAASAGEVWLTRSVHLAMNHVEVAAEPLIAGAIGADADRAAVYRARRSQCEAAGGAALAVMQPGRLERALEPLSDAFASIEDGAVHERAWATLRVLCAAAALAIFGVAELLVLGALAGSGVAALMARSRGGASPRVDRLSRSVAAARTWLRSRRAIPRAALIRPLW